ncbi:hypothetical protein TCE0_013f00896 [Talaromyces pinophilus]|uniref:Uncharacterized protein n=1 Tax=Talaromyces pinophilus TaxID=128442 RepID=A0A698XLA7_TALPI|nr:hypothetical protein TCE0_013f00896 [Talaromyces pinophilus]
MDTGSPSAAQDLYGIGVRIGFYLQALAMILYNYNKEGNYGRGLKLASGSITISILAAWFTFAAKRLFSPAEAFSMLLILMSLSFPAKTTLLRPKTVLGEILGLVALLVTELATCAALLWMFATLVHSLPALGTGNVIFFFARVSITGWFRYLALVYFVLDAITSLLFARKVIRVIGIAWRYGISTREEEDDDDDAIITEIKEAIGWDNSKQHIPVLHALILTWVIVAVELNITWNHLSPSTDLQVPGQLIPLVTGATILADSIFVTCRCKFGAVTAGINKGILVFVGSISYIFDRLQSYLIKLKGGLQLPKRDPQVPGLDPASEVKV